MARKVDPASHEQWLKCSIMGPSGSGKSSLGATAPRPLIALSEKQGKESALARARQLQLPDPIIVEMDTLQDYRDLLSSMHGDRSKPFRWVAHDGSEVLTMEQWPETLVVDSLSDACELVEQAIRREAPPKKGDDGLEVFSQRHWNELKKRCQRLIRAFRDVQAHVLFLSLVDERTVETSDGMTTRTVQPQLPMRKLPDILMQATHMCGLMQRRPKRQDDGTVLRRSAEDGEPENIVLEVRVLTNAPSYIKVKPHEALNDVEIPDFTSWVERWRAYINGPEQTMAAAAGGV